MDHYVPFRIRMNLLLATFLLGSPPLARNLDPAGWLPWNASGFALDTLFYAEVDNTGPGAGTTKRVRWGGIRNVTYEEAQEEFTVDAFLQGQQFIPKYGVPLIRRLLPRSVRT
jgi:pectinesterase